MRTAAQELVTKTGFYWLPKELVVSISRLLER